MQSRPKIRKSIASGCFVLVKPKRLGDAEEIARAIAACRGIRKVFLSSGEYGFVASAESEASLGEARSMIRGMAAGRVKIVRNHYVYRSLAKH